MHVTCSGSIIILQMRTVYEYNLFVYIQGMYDLAIYSYTHTHTHTHTVYLRTSPEVCYKRLQERGRKEEKPVTLVRPHLHTYMYMYIIPHLHQNIVSLLSLSSNMS